MDFEGKILNWYQKNKRDLPWRKTRKPYEIWLSEVILQQTRVQQGLPYYFSFLNKFPTINKLAEASEHDILKLWQGLGYYSRARNLHSAAKSIVSEHKGQFPETFLELKKLKGIGDYTAAAISSFCFNEVQAVVDGNVYRVLSRIFGIDTPIDSTEGKKEFRELANELISQKHPGEFNQAIMEFGALQCVPKNPDCEKCPFVQFCVARKKKMIDVLPIKLKKTKVTNRYFYYLVIRHKGNVYLKKRTEKDIWRNLHDFPLIETKEKLSEKKLIQTKEWKSFFSNSKIVVNDFSDEVKHVLSHQKLFVRFVVVDVKEKLKGKKEWLYIKEKELSKYAVPVVMERFIKQL
ncbi:MAG: A/G-specific adenine glycosylase [Bacteroidetes bacterium]|nr:A/G-specific adenine glycosylase [Bacteroidota bacterium]